MFADRRRSRHESVLPYTLAALQPESARAFLSAKQAPSSGFPIRFCSGTPSLTMVRPYMEPHPRWTNCRRHLDAHPEPEFWWVFALLAWVTKEGPLARRSTEEVATRAVGAAVSAVIKRVSGRGVRPPSRVLTAG
eukprot:COSAG01_NODE_4414_length_5050_cov_27.191476_2_plen_135_part_00